MAEGIGGWQGLLKQMGFTKIKALTNHKRIVIEKIKKRSFTKIKALTNLATHQCPPPRVYQSGTE